MQEKSKKSTTMDTQLSKSKKKRSSVRYSYNGHLYSSKKDIALALGISVSTLYAYTKSGLSIKEAVDLAITNKKKYTYNGKNYKTLKDMCEKNGLTVATVRYYSDKHQKTYQESIRILKIKKTKRDKYLKELREKYFPGDL